MNGVVIELPVQILYKGFYSLDIFYAFPQFPPVQAPCFPVQLSFDLVDGDPCKIYGPVMEFKPEEFNDFPRYRTDHLALVDLQTFPVKEGVNNGFKFFDLFFCFGKDDHIIGITDIWNRMFRKPAVHTAEIEIGKESG